MHFSHHAFSALCILVTGISAGLIDPNHMVDVGNVACVGSCVADVKSLNCQTPLYKPEKQCYVCCYSDDNADKGADQDGWTDHAGDWDKNLRLPEGK